MPVDFRVLGDVEVHVDGRLVDVGHARQRCVLVLLLINANRGVTIDQLIERAWGEHAPQRARGALYTYLARLRRALVAADDVSIDRRSSGYVLTVDPMAVDLHRFRRLVERARAADDGEAAAALLEGALGLWRGEAFATLDTPWLNNVRDTLDQERLAAELDRNDLQLRFGHHAALLSRLSARADTDPFDERLAGQLMLALYRSGRPAEALRHYQRIRLRLADELGTDPSPRLQQLHRQMLQADPVLDLVVATEAAGQPPVTPVPHQLPPPERHFIGRMGALQALTNLLDEAARQDGAMAVSAIDGTAGIGKSTFALYGAHQMAHRFPDGQLYVDLRGFDPSGLALDPAEALREFLEGLGVPVQRIPADLDARAALYRSLLTGKRVLILLDNARDTEQVRALLPSAPGCAVLVTSRRQLSGLVAGHGAQLLTLDVFTPAEAKALLADRLGPGRIAAEPRAVEEIITRCARLPLALAVVAARAVAHPSFPLAAFSGELQHVGERLNAFAGPDLAGGVRAVLSWSYRRLSPDAARLFRLLGLHPGPDIAIGAAASLTGASSGQVRPLLAELAHAHLLVEYKPGRYTFHDLLRAFAMEQAHSHERDADRRAATDRLLDYYLTSAAAVVKILYPGELLIWALTSAPATPGHTALNRTAAREWLEAEGPNLVAVWFQAAGHGWTRHMIGLTDVVARYLDSKASTTSVRVERAGEPATEEAGALTALGLILWRRGELGRANECLRQGLARSRQVGDQTIEAWALTGLGGVCRRQNHHHWAAEYLNQALVLSRQIGNSTIESMVLHELGTWPNAGPA